MNKILSAPPNALALARDVLNIEAAAVQALSSRLDESFISAMNVVLHCEGRVIVSGMGKSGHIARKIAATLSSTGTPAYFVHPAEASHGDLGMITSQDVIIALSYSGESQELMTIVPVIKRQGAKLISMTGNPSSSLAKVSDVHLNAAVDKEACPMGLAPTASTTAALALGDALAVALLDAKGFGAEDFARSHPGGSLGRRLLTHVSDVMHTGERLPMVSTGCDAGRRGAGNLAKGRGHDRHRGRRAARAGHLHRRRPAPHAGKEAGFQHHAGQHRDVARPAPHRPRCLAVEAVQMMEQYNISQMLVVDEHKKLVGALNMHDLLNAKVIYDARRKNQTAKYRLIAFDVDGVLTDGGLYLSDSGEEFKRFNSLDGHGLKMLKPSGWSLPSSPAALRVASNTRQEPRHHACLSGRGKQARSHGRTAGKLKLAAEAAAFMGDDVVDLPVMRHVGLAISVPESPLLVRKLSHYVTQRGGGYGAVREACELIMSAQGTLDAQLAPFLQ